MNSLLEFDELIDAVHGTAVTASPSEYIVFSSVCTDSRMVVPGSLFVPLIGTSQDGHKYIPQAIDKGASVLFVAESEYNGKTELYRGLSESKKVSFVVVRNTLTALQDAAAAYVRKFPALIKIGITGSSGKTTTKELCVSVFKQKYRVVSTVGNLNSETGLPLSVFHITKDDQVGIFELGMNRRNEIAEIAGVLRPEYAVITNIGTAHIGMLGSRNAIAEEKKKIFTYIDEHGAAFIPADDDYAGYLAEGVKGAVVRYGRTAAAAGVCFVADKGIAGTEFTVDGVPVELHLPGRYNYQNALGVIALARHLGVSAEQIKNGIESLSPLDGRGQLLHLQVRKSDEAACGDMPCRLQVFQDCYNANPDSLAKTLELCASVTGRKIYVLGDMLELGEASAASHEEAGRLAAASAGNAGDLIVFVGPEMRNAQQAAAGKTAAKILHFTEYDDKAMQMLCTQLHAYIQDGDFILLKGSHGIGLERITAFFKEHAYGNV